MSSVINNIKQFFQMGHYGGYVWSAYGIVLLYLSLQWIVTLRKGWIFYKPLLRAINIKNYYESNT